MVMARFHSCLKHWWMRGLKEENKIISHNKESAIEKFKKKLRWSKTETWFDHDDVGLLFYAVSSNEENVVTDLLVEMKRSFEGKGYSRVLESRLRKEGYTALGLSGEATALMIAMASASPEVVSMLLESGANVESVDVVGKDACIFASMFGRPLNLKCWLEKVKDWDMNRKNTILGGCALGLAVYMGANKLETVKVLLDAGASLDYRSFTGGTLQTNVTENEDSDPDVVRLVLNAIKESCDDNDGGTEFKRIMNYQVSASTRKWKTYYFAAKCLYRTGIVASTGLLGSIALDSGTTPLNLAVKRGDLEIVNILLESGADPFIKNDLDMNAFDLCEKLGPFPQIRNELWAHVKDTTDPVELWDHVISRNFSVPEVDL